MKHNSVSIWWRKTYINILVWVSANWAQWAINGPTGPLSFQGVYLQLSVHGKGPTNMAQVSKETGNLNLFAIGQMVYSGFSLFSPAWTGLKVQWIISKFATVSLFDLNILFVHTLKYDHHHEESFCFFVFAVPTKCTKFTGLVPVIFNECSSKWTSLRLRGYKLINLWAKHE